MEKSSNPCLRLATALPETAAGIEGNFGSPDAPRRIAAQIASRTRADCFFIPLILPHLFFGGGSQSQIFRTMFCGGIRGRHRQMRLREPWLRGGRAASA